MQPVETDDATEPVSSGSNLAALDPKAPSDRIDDAAKSARSASSSRQPSAQPEIIQPAKIASPQPEEGANLSTSTEELLDQQRTSEPAKTIHLPPRNVQEENLHEREAEQESKPSQRPAAANPEVASSPSSTVDAYSASTPQPPQDSPDTSPDSENTQIEVQPPKDLQPSPEQQREQEEHDRLLEAQKEIARKQALGDVSTPDEQLKWEEREAAAREASEREAREDGGPEPNARAPRESTEAEQMADAMQVDDMSHEDQKPAESDANPHSKQAETEVAHDKMVADKPRAAVDKSKQQSSVVADRRTASPVIARPPRMTTRVSSGAMRQKSVSEILGQERDRSHSTDVTPVTRRVHSSEPQSPLTQRHAQDDIKPQLRTSLPMHTQRQPRLLSQYRTQANTDPKMEQLESLRGAAEDPDKDYLEPLFRIQAHEAPNNTRSHTLPELVKDSKKVLSTEDQFAALHERLDFRMLRRIYQLQNANKWSLRQMEKQAEPEQPFTHHDHMMDEMKWMRKDFKAERKMKKSVCAWLAQRCSEWYHADAQERKLLQVKVKPPSAKQRSEAPALVPELEHGLESANEDDAAPGTPREGSPVPTTVVIPPELAGAFEDLRKAGKLSKVLSNVPKTGLLDLAKRHPAEPYTILSKFVEGKVLPKTSQPTKKRSRYDYEDEAEALDAEPSRKRLRDQYQVPAEGTDCALFDPENKPIRDRLHSNNAFRPPSEFLMPTTHFYEYRSGSQWIWEDDQKLRKLAKEYSFNWSLIADEMSLSTRFKSSAERRTPWECFERWVDLESLPADMRKTVYFKTWLNRLNSSQQAADQRYNAQVQAIQQQAAQTGAQAHVPMRRRTTPTRVEKRRSSRYLWIVDGFRKLAKKREQAAWKQAETARATAARKSQTDNSNPAPRTYRMTPQEFSKKRHERDMQLAEAQRQHRAKIIEAQQRQYQAQRAAQMQAQGGMPAGASQSSANGQQRPQTANMPPQQAPMGPNGQPMSAVARMAVQQQGGAPMQMSTVNGRLAPPPVNGQGLSQAQIQARTAQMAQNPNMQQMQQANPQMRNGQYPSQQYPMPNGNMAASPGNSLSTAQQLQNNQALLAAYQQQQQSQGGTGQSPSINQTNTAQQPNSSPSMPPPPTPSSVPQQLSSGHVPQIIAIKNQLRATNPQASEDQLNAMAGQQLKNQSQSQSSNQARQNAMNAAAGITSQYNAGLPSQTPTYNQAAYQNNGQMANGVNGGMYPQMNGAATGQQQVPNMSPAGTNGSPSQDLQAQYRQQMWKKQQMQMQSPNAVPAQMNGSPGVAHASPSMLPASPSMQYNNMQQMSGQMPGMNGQRPSSRSNTPQTQRIGSSGSGVGMNNGNGMQSPGVQGSPRNMPAGMAR